MIYSMKLRPDSFDKIKEGRKTVELRLFDEKRRNIRLGDRIEFQKEPGREEKVAVEVIGLLHYPSFEELIEDIPLNYLGRTDKKILLEGVHSIYTTDSELENGVLGIKIRLLGSS